MNLLATACTILLLLGAAGCVPSPGPAPQALAEPPSASSPECPSSARVAILQDQTGSRTASLTPVLTPADLEPIAGLLLACGGELRVGEIRESAPGAFAALRIGAPPVPLLEPSAWPTNPFDRADARAAHEKERALSEAARAAWARESEQRVAEFRSALESRWTGQRLAHRSDVWSALERAQLFLEEPTSPLRGSVRRWLLLLSDGEHTAAPPAHAFQLDPRITLIVVNSAGHQGQLGPLNPRRFESLDAAVQWIVEESTRHIGEKEEPDA